MLLDFGTLLGVVLGLGVARLSLGRSDAFTDDQMVCPQDDWLGDRMGELGIPSWQALQQRSGLSRATLRRLRQGDIAAIRMRQLTQLATALDWPLSRLVQALSGENVPVVFIGEADCVPQPDVGRTTELEQECQRLQAQLTQQQANLNAEFRAETFEILQMLLTNVASVKQMVAQKPELPAKNLLALLTPLETLMQRWNYEPIGNAGARVAYDPQVHQGDCDDLQAGEPVYVRAIGYRSGEQIMAPARVSRTLPGGMV